MLWCHSFSRHWELNVLQVVEVVLVPRGGVAAMMID
jgi:hypothetical protein